MNLTPGPKKIPHHMPSMSMPRRRRRQQEKEDKEKEDKEVALALAELHRLHESARVLQRWFRRRGLTSSYVLV